MKTNIKRTVGLPNFSFGKFQKRRNFEILMGKNEGFTFPSLRITSFIGFLGIPDGNGGQKGDKMKTSNIKQTNEE